MQPARPSPDHREQFETTDRARPLKGAKDDVIGVARRFLQERKSCRSMVRRNGSRLARSAGSRASRSRTTSSKVRPNRSLRERRK